MTPRSFAVTCVGWSAGSAGEGMLAARVPALTRATGSAPTGLPPNFVAMSGWTRPEASEYSKEPWVIAVAFCEAVLELHVTISTTATITTGMRRAAAQNERRRTTRRTSKPITVLSCDVMRHPRVRRDRRRGRRFHPYSWRGIQRPKLRHPLGPARLTVSHRQCRRPVAGRSGHRPAWCPDTDSRAGCPGPLAREFDAHRPVLAPPLTDRMPRPGRRAAGVSGRRAVRPRPSGG